MRAEQQIHCAVVQHLRARIEIEMVRAETGETGLASARHAAFLRKLGWHLRDEKYAISLTSDCASDQFLRAPTGIYKCRVDQCHPKRKACTQRFLFKSCGTSPLSDVPRTLTQCRYDGAVTKLHCPYCI